MNRRKIMRNKNIWIFNATNDFMGNVKYMFLYINEKHPEIEAIWMCDDKKIVDKIKDLGYEAFLYSDPKADVFKQKAGVFVVHQVKQHFPALFNDEVIILNLWHGVGLKPVERYVDSSGIKEITYRKYIKYNNIYRNNQLFLVSSPFMEEHFRKHLKLEDHNIVRGGYPANKLNDMYKVDNYEIDTTKKLYCTHRHLGIMQ